tara:strand:+ start:400 stop:1071 length:672 start_codon:yes stop_codon:yes gene_type:complete
MLALENFADKKKLFDDLNIELRHLSGQGNIGYGSAHNLTLHKLDSDFHLMLNPDVILENETLLNAINMMTQDHDVKLVSPHAIDQEGAKQYLCKHYPSVLTLLMRGIFPVFLKKLFVNRLADYEMRGLTEAEISDNIKLASGCFMFVDTRALQTIGGFDESFFLYFEDFDLSLRMGRLGKLLYAPNVRITHSGGFAARKGFWHVKVFITSGYRFFNKHGWLFF